MNLTPQETRTQFVNSIMMENNVSQKSIRKCLEESSDELDSMDQIFDSNDKISVIKRMVLLSLISRINAWENVDYYLKANNINSSDDEIDKYKVLIITALKANATFYVDASHWCQAIRWEVEQEVKVKPYPQPRFPILRFKTKDDSDAAGGTVFAEFYKESITYNDIHGTLFFKGNDQNEVRLEFLFEKFHEPFPFELEVRFTTKYDHKEHIITIPADSAMEGDDPIKSEIISNVYHKDGIEGEYTVTIKPLDNSKN